MQAVKQAVGVDGGPRLAWIGLGNMGRGMIKNIVEKGTYTAPVLIYNRTPARAENLAATLPTNKIQVSTSIEECVKASDMIFTCVSDDAAVTSVIDTALRTTNAKGKLFVDCSTVHPDTTNRMASLAINAGAEFVACPVFGVAAMANSGQLVCALAGPKASVEKVRPFCKGVMGRAEVDYSDQPQGNASRLKIIGNTMIFHVVESLAEGHVLAEKSGLGSDNFHAFIEAMFPGPQTLYSQRMRTGEYYLIGEPAFAAKLAKKDYDHAKSLANEAGVQVKALDEVGKHLGAVVDYAGNKGDLPGVYGAVRMEAGLPFENQKSTK